MKDLINTVNKVLTEAVVYSTVSPSVVKKTISQHKKGTLKGVPVAITRFLKWASFSFTKLSDIEKTRLNDLVVAGLVKKKGHQWILTV